MIVLILGASGKVGRYLVEKILSRELLPLTTHLILQYNSQNVFEGITQIKNSQLNVKLIKMDILDTKSIEDFLNTLPNKIDVLINLLSIFEETPYNSSLDKIQNVMKINFLNQILLLTNLFPMLENGSIVQFFDYCVKKPYIKKYFWYSVSRNALYMFFKYFEKYATQNNKTYRFLYLLPRNITQKDYDKIKTIISDWILSTKEDKLNIKEIIL